MLRLKQRLQSAMKRRQNLWLLLFVIVLFAVLSYLQSDPTFADPDSFYHAKLTMLLSQQGIFTEFPWLSLTTLNYIFIDHHFLYHLLLIPLVSIFPPLLGMKISAVLFAAACILTITWFLKEQRVGQAYWYGLFLLTINPFIFRLSLAKAPALALALVFLLSGCLISRRYLALAILSFLFVWTYGGWPLLIVMLLVQLASGLISRLISGKKLWPKKNFWQDLSLVFSVFGGVIAGLVINPYFPKNLYFLWQQVFEIALVNYQGLLRVGAEWYPFGPFELFLIMVPTFILYFLAWCYFVITFRRQSAGSWYLFIMSFLFFALTLKSKRYVEYFVPFAVCFSAVSLKDFWQVLRGFGELLLGKKYLFLAPVIIFIVCSPFFVRDFFQVKNSLAQSGSLTEYQPAAEWLKNNSQSGQIVFHSDWDEFPALFYYNDLNYYLVGLDPTFMYKLEPQLYQLYTRITFGKEKENLYRYIKELFSSSYVFVNYSQNPDFDRNLSENIFFEQVYSDDKFRIYRVL